VSDRESIALPVPPGALRVSAAAQGASIVLSLEGAAELQSHQPIDALLAELHRQALARRVSEVIVDVRRLEFMNSSGFKGFVSWVAALEELDPAAGGYRVRFLSDANVLWQRRSLHALRCFAPDRVSVETGV
jgi:hypothetical protein